MVDSPLGAVGIKYFQTVALCFDIITDRFQSRGGLPDGKESLQRIRQNNFFKN